MSAVLAFARFTFNLGIVAVGALILFAMFVACLLEGFAYKQEDRNDTESPHKSEGQKRRAA